MKSGTIVELWLVFMSLELDMYHCDTLCRTNGGDFKRCKSIGNQEFDASVTKFQRTLAGIQCRHNHTITICHYINDSMGYDQQKKPNRTCDVIVAESFHLKFLYIVVHDDTNISRIVEVLKILNRTQNQRSANQSKYTGQDSNETLPLTRFKNQGNQFSLYMKNLTTRLHEIREYNCHFHILFFIFPNINRIIRYFSGKTGRQLATYCNVTILPDIRVYQSQDLNGTLLAMIKEMRYYLENQCLFKDSNGTQVTKPTVTKKEDNDGTSVTLLVPIVIVGFIVFSCILTMRFCSEGESTLMMRAKIMKYQPEKDKQLLALIYQQIQKEGKPQIEPRTYTASSDLRISKKKTMKTSERGLFACQPCCSKDVFRGPLVSTIACGLAPLKKATV